MKITKTKDGCKIVWTIEALTANEVSSTEGAVNFLKQKIRLDAIPTDGTPEIIFDTQTKPQQSEEKIANKIVSLLDGLSAIEANKTIDAATEKMRKYCILNSL